MQKIFLVTNLFFGLMVFSAWGAPKYSIKVYEDYTLTNGMAICVPLIGNYVSEKEWQSVYYRGAVGNYSWVENCIGTRLKEHGIACGRDVESNGVQSRYKITYTYNEGIGRPSMGRHWNLTFRMIYAMKLQLISLRTNKVVAEVTFRRNRLGYHDHAFVYKMVDMLYTKGAIVESLATKHYPQIAD